MTLAEFVDSDSSSHNGALQALWFAGRGDWELAHEIAQADDSREAAWVHAYLHREEGDTSNAAYWYRRAGRPAYTGDLRTEWETIVRELLEQPS